MNKFYANTLRNNSPRYYRFLFTLLISLGSFSAIFAQAPAGWAYSRPVILSTPTTLVNYQVKITLNAGDYANMQSNGADLRFYDNTNTSCPYWIETFNTAGTSTIWVKVVTQGSNLTMYYGNASATAASNGINTFDFFEDFSTPIGTRWNVSTTGGTVIQSANSITLTGTSTSAVGVSLSNSTAFNIVSPSFFLETKHKEVGYYRNRMYATNTSLGICPIASFDYGYFSETAGAQTAAKIYWNAFPATSVMANNTDYLTAWQITNNSTYNWYTYNYATGLPVDATVRNTTYNGSVRFITFKNNQAANTSTIVNWVRVRKSQATDPATTVGAEVTLPVISGLSTSVGCPGDNIIINGSNFTGTSSVKIGGTVVASITSITATQVEAVIGNGTAGVVSVTTPSGTGVSAGSFTVNPNSNISLSSAPGTANQVACAGTAIASIVYAVGGGGTTTVSGLPAGVTDRKSVV